MRRPLAVLVLAGACTTATCLPSLGAGDSLVTSTRILAVRADPAEARPGASMTFTTLVASPKGTVAFPPIVWTFCTAPKPVTEDNVVSAACLGTTSLVAAGVGPTTTALTPSDGCSIFGPGTAAPDLRPRDPDGTDGYYQPIRADLPGADTAFGLARIRCDLANASASAASAFAAAYHPNDNPQLLALRATLAGAPADLTAIPAGARVALEASWPAASAETFAYFDPVSQTVTTQREAMQVAWYSNGGALDTESTGRAGSDFETTSANAWTAPGTSGAVHLWVVLRDSRGGVDFAEYAVLVRE